MSTTSTFLPTEPPSTLRGAVRSICIALDWFEQDDDADAAELAHFALNDIEAVIAHLEKEGQRLPPLPLNPTSPPAKGKARVQDTARPG